jgi:uncharacterized protein YqjF (DUF2071 family)
LVVGMAMALVVMVPADRHPAAPPAGPWIMVQRWHELLFAHWRCPIGELRPLIPPPLEIETYDGDAWISVVPFYMTGVRLRLAPPVPTASSFQELNVRTYVTLDSRPGVWFFSLDCQSTLAVVGARAGARLPYYRANMRMNSAHGAIEYDSQRWAMHGSSAAFSAAYRGTGERYTSLPGSLDHFLTERYCLYSSDGQRIWRVDIFHPRWSLQSAEATIDTNSMLAAAGVHTIGDDPLLQFSAFQDVRVWLPQRVR